MRRWLSLIAVAMTLLVGSLLPVSAQESSTPEAGDGPTATVIFGADGKPEGEVSVSAVADPFEDYDPSSAPQRGFHYVAAIVTITATGDHAIEANSYGFAVVDTDGFLYSQTYVYRTSESSSSSPDFPGGTVEPGQSMSGAIFFQALDGTKAALINYQPSYDRVVTAVDLRESAVAEGNAVEFLANDGSPAATISASGIISPLEDYDPSYVPQRGFEYLGVTVTIENTGAKVFEADPYDFVFVDAEGFIYNSYGVYRTPEAEAQAPSLQYSSELAPGGSVTGIVSFQVLAGTKPGMIYFSPSGDRHVRLAEFGEDQAPRPAGTPDISVTLPKPKLNETPESSTSNADCRGVLEWGQDLLPKITEWSELLSSIAPVFTGGTVDPSVVREAADASSEIGDSVEDSDPPEIARAANDALAAMFRETADALNELADAIEEGDEAAISAATEKLTQIQSGEELNTAFDELTAACPELESLG